MPLASKTGSSRDVKALAESFSTRCVPYHRQPSLRFAEHFRSRVGFCWPLQRGQIKRNKHPRESNRLAFVSKTPGRTQHINFFSVGEDRFLVDLPGYGFANAPFAVKAHWEELVGGYLETREQLTGLVLIMDARHPLKDLDRDLLAWFMPQNKPVHVLLTKCDKLSRQAKIEALRHVQTELAKLPIQSSAQLFSSLSREGLEEAITTIWQLLDLRLQKP